MHLGQPWASGTPGYDSSAPPIYVAPVYSDPEPGTPEFSAQAAVRRATIAATPIPATQGPGLLVLPAKYAGQGIAAGGRALVAGLGGTGTLLLIGGLVAAGYFLLRGRRS